MSDILLYPYLKYGTNAERLAFTPAPIAGNKMLYAWRETDTGSLYLYDTAWHLVAVGTTSKLVQQVVTQVSAVNSGSTQIPADDTIPQNGEGIEFMTLAITPTNAANRLVIDAQCMLASSVTARYGTMALFQDTTVDALAATVGYFRDTNSMFQQPLAHHMTAGTTSATTFKIRAGLHSTGTLTFNGVAAGRLYGGVASSFIRISEIIP